MVINVKKLTAKILAAVVGASMLLAGCSSGTTSSTDSSAASSSDSSTVSSEVSSDSSSSAEDASIVVAVASQIANLDPGLNSTTHLAHIISNGTVGLFRTNEEGVLENMMCEDYTISEDGLTYTFKIKEGVEWSDGQPLTAHDWVYGIKRTIGYGPDNTYVAADMCRFIKGAEEANEAMMDVADMTDVGVSAPDDYTLVIELKTPCPYFIKIVGGNAFAPLRADFAVEHESTWSLQPGYPTVGAYQLASCNENESAVYVKNENYSIADEIGLDQITYQVMPDENAQLAAFKAGQIDMAFNVPATIGSSTEYADYFFKPDSYTSTYFVALNSGTKGVEALKDVRVRKALALAVNKDAMLTVLNGGDYVTPLNGMVPYGFEGLNGDFRAEANDYLPYNVEEAKALLAEAGYNESNPLKLEYLYSNAQFHADVAQMLQQLWAAIGVEVELKAVEMGVFYDYVDYGDFQMARYSIASSTDPLTYLKTFMTENQIEPCVSDATYDQMIADAYNIVDTQEYITALHEAEEYLVNEQAYLIPLLTQQSVVLKQPYIEGVWANPGGTIYFNHASLAQ